MKKLLLFLPLILLSCKQDKKAMLERTWRAAALNNPQMNDIVMNGQTFIDTVGSHTNADANVDLYGTNNIDSLKKGLQLQLDSLKTDQLNTVQQTVFTFRKDGVAMISFNGNTDSSKWYLDDQGNIVLDELKEKGAGDIIKMRIESLTDTALLLNFEENGTNSVVTFHPDKK